jgi:hypothetical protein
MTNSKKGNLASKGKPKNAKVDKILKKANLNKKTKLVPKPAQTMKNPSLSDASPIPPTVTTLVGTYALPKFEELALAVLEKFYAEEGSYPSDLKEMTYGPMVFYLLGCFGAYLIRCGTWKTDLEDIPAYSSYCVPDWIATIFKCSVVAKIKGTETEIRASIPTFYSDLTSHATNYGAPRFPVAIGVAANGEPTFNVGTVFTWANMTTSIANVIDVAIRSSHPHVHVINDIPDHCSDLGQFVGKNEVGKTQTSFCPVSGAQHELALIDYNELFYPCLVNHFSHDTDSRAVHLIAYILENEPMLKSDDTINTLLRRKGFDPWRLTVTAIPLNASRFCEIVCQFLIRNGSITPNSSGITAWQGVLNYYCYFFTVYSAHQHWISRNLASHNITFYITKAMKSGSLFPALVAPGFLPAKVDNSLIVPYWETAANDFSFFTAFQQNANTVAGSIVELGAIPITGTIPSSYSLAYSAPLAPGTVANVVPLMTYDALRASCVAVNNAISAQASLIKSRASVCACVCNCETTTNEFLVSSAVGSAFKILWSTIDRMDSPIFLDTYQCKAQIGCGLLDAMRTSYFRSKFVNPVGDEVATCVECGMRDSNFENFAAANPRNDPSTSWMNFFRNRLLDTVETFEDNIKGKDLARLAKLAADAGIEDAPLISHFWNDLSGTYDLSYLVRAAATGLVEYGPALLQLLRERDNIRVRRNEL